MRQPIPCGLAGTAPRRAFGLVFRAVFVVFSVACAWYRQAHATVSNEFQNYF